MGLHFFFCGSRQFHRNERATFGAATHRSRGKSQKSRKLISSASHLQGQCRSQKSPKRQNSIDFPIWSPSLARSLDETRHLNFGTHCPDFGAKLAKSCPKIGRLPWLSGGASFATATPQTSEFDRLSLSGHLLNVAVCSGHHHTGGGCKVTWGAFIAAPLGAIVATPSERGRLARRLVTGMWGHDRHLWATSWRNEGHSGAGERCRWAEAPSLGSSTNQEGDPLECRVLATPICLALWRALHNSPFEDVLARKGQLLSLI